MASVKKIPAGLSPAELKRQKEEARHNIEKQYHGVVEIYEYLTQFLSSLTAIQKEQLRRVVGGADSARKEITWIFAGPEFYDKCRNCGSGCCGGGGYLFDWTAILCMVFNNIPIPKPRKHLIVRCSLGMGTRFDTYRRCAFLSRTGCLLGDYRSLTCISFYCGYFRHDRRKTDDDLREIREITGRYSVSAAKIWSLMNDFGFSFVPSGIPSEQINKRIVRNDCESN